LLQEKSLKEKKPKKKSIPSLVNSGGMPTLFSSGAERLVCVERGKRITVS